MNGFKLDEKQLLAQYGQAKQIEIENLLTQYGSSLKQVREMYPQLTTAIEKKRLTTTLQTQPFFFSPGEVGQMGLSIQEGWMLKMSPFNGGYKSSLITPEKWEITEDDLYISPSGDQFTRLELETALGMGQVPSLEQLGQPSLEIEQIFGGVFPEKDIAEVLAYAESDPEAFRRDILEIGRTPETEALLKAMYEGVTEEWLDELFGPSDLRQLLIEALPAVTENSFDVVVEHFGEHPEALRAALMYAGRNESTEKLVRMLFPDITDHQMSDYFNPLSLIVEAKAAEGPQGLWGTFTAGVGDLVANVGGIFKWCGAEGVGDKIIKFGQFLQVQAAPVPFEPDEFTWGQLFNPQFYATYGVRMLPTLMVLAIPGIGAYSLAAGTAAKLGLGLAGRAIIAGIGGAIMSRPIESALEAGGAYDLARQKGLSHEEANEAADSVFNKNMALVGMDAAQIAVAFMPIPGGVGVAAKGAIARGLVTTAKIASKLVFTGLTEGGEELLQEMFQKVALGEEVDLSDPDMQLVFSLGMIAGIGMGGGADIIMRIMSKGVQQLTPDQRVLFDKSKAAHIAQGLKEDIATQKAFDEVIEQHPEVGEAIQKATREVEREIAGEQVEQLVQKRAGKPTLAIPSEETPPAETTMPVGGKAGLGVKDVSTVFPQDEDIDVALEIPDSKAIIDGLIVPNWIRTTLKGIARVPVFKKIHETTLGWRSLIAKTSQLTEDIVGRAAVVYGAVRRMGVDVARIRVGALKNTIPNPVKYFEFNDVGYSEMMAARLLPEYASEKEDAGTLEHVFTKPEMYNWTGMDAGLVYVSRVHRIIATMNKLLRREGVGFAAVSERWIHRVVTGRTIEGEVVGVRGKPGRAGARPGAVPSYKKPRTFKTMAAGIEALIQYEPNIEVSISSFIEEAYKEIAGTRFTKMVEEFGVTPGERLLERYPEVAERAELTKTDLADAAKLHALTLRAKRGEKLPQQTLTAIQKRFPELGRRLRGLVEQGGEGEKQLRKLLTQNDKYIKGLQAQLAQARKPTPAEAKVERIAPPEPVEIPDEQRLTEAFRLMDYEDRLAFRRTMESQLEEIERMVYEQGVELEAMTETFQADPARKFIDIVAKTGEYKGEIAYLTVTQYRLLTGAKWVVQTMEKMGKKVKTKVLIGGKTPNASIMTPDGTKVRWEYAMDEVAQELGYENDEAFKNAIEKALDTKHTIDDYKVMVNAGEERLTGIKRMLRTMDNVDRAPENIESAEPVEPAQGITEREARYGFLQLTEEQHEEAIKSGRYPEPGRHEELTEYYTEPHEPGWKGLSLAEMFPTKYKDLLERGVPDKLSPFQVQQVIEERRIPYELGEEAAPYGPEVTPSEEANYELFARQSANKLGLEGEISLKFSDKPMTEYGEWKEITSGKYEIILNISRSEIATKDTIIHELTHIQRTQRGLPKQVGYHSSDFYRDWDANRELLGQEITPIGELTQTPPEAERLAQMPEAMPGMPEAGLQQDWFGYTHRAVPKGKGEIVQISMDDYQKLVEHYEEEGKPMPYMRVKPKIEGISELSGDTEFQQEIFSAPDEKTQDQRKADFEQLASEANALMEGRKAPYWQARAARAAAMEIVRQPGIGEGYLPMPFAGGKIYNQDFIDGCNKFFGVDKGNPVLKFTSDAAGILRITKAALDFSAMMIQGLPSFGLAHSYLAINPRIGAKLMGQWYKALGLSTASFFDPGVFYGHLAKNEQAALQRISFGGSSRAIDYFETLKAKHGLGAIAAWTLSKIPLQPFERAEIAFYAAGEMVRNGFWEALSPQAIKQGKAFELARSLDLMTGLAQAESMGVPLTMRQLESSFMWFAPNYTRACLSLLADIFRGGYTGMKAKQALGGMMAAGAIYYTGIQLAMALLSGKDMDDALDDVKQGFGIREDPITHEVTWRPLSDFMGVKVGNYTFGVGSFWYGFIRLIGNISEVINEVGDKERIDFVTILKNGAPNRDNPFIYWWYTRASPLTGMFFELSTHKDFLGYPIETIGEYAQYLLTRFEPIWMEQGLNWMIPGAARDYEIPEGAARAAIIPFELFGWRSVPESTWVNFYDKADEYIKQIPQGELDVQQVEAWQAGDLGWAQLTRIQKQDLIQRYPELAGLYEEAQNDSRIRQTPEWEAYTDRTDEERAIYYDRIDELTRRLQAGELDTRTYRELASEAGMNYGSIIESIQRDETYAEIFEYFEKKEAEGSKYEFTSDLAMAEYDSLIRFAEDPGIYLANGDYNWDERDRRIDSFVEKWGEKLYSAILSYISTAKEEKGLNDVWVRRGQDTESLGRGYWRLPYQPIMDMTQEDFSEGNIPAQYYGLWQTYEGLADEDKEGFVTLHPELAKDWRAAYRKDNPEADAMLALWGYSGKLQSMEAYNMVKKWGDELGIPLGQMGLGLPPQSLIEDYFDYGSLATEFSGNSAESKLWRLENPEFANWAMENWGWEGTEDYKGIEYYQLQIKNRPFEEEYGAIDSKNTMARQKYLDAHPEFRDDRYRLKGMDYGMAEDLIEQYVEYQSSEFKDYEDDWWLIDHPEFYKAMYDLDIWTEPRDFSKVPSREVYALYQTYQGLPSGTPRYDFRAKHLDLDAWLVLKFGYKPIGDRGNKEAEKTPWEEAAEVEQFKELF